MSSEQMLEKIRQLQKENEYLKRQREILKKAMSIPGEEPHSGHLHPEQNFRRNYPEKSSANCAQRNKSAVPMKMGLCPQPPPPTTVDTRTRAEEVARRAREGAARVLATMERESKRQTQNVSPSSALARTTDLFPKKLVGWI